MSGGQSDQSAYPRGRDVAVFGDESQGSGWLFFAGTILGLAGLMRVVDALWAFGYDGALPENLTDGVIGEDLNNYAWVWLGVGLVLIRRSNAISSWNSGEPKVGGGPGRNWSPRVMSQGL